jgi:hypothetical protein
MKLDGAAPERRNGILLTRRRRFWCPFYRREVEVEFAERGLSGFRRQLGVESCSVFDPPTAVECARRCLDPVYRRQWDPPLPVLSRRQA